MISNQILQNTIDGLKGINCRHDFYPFFEGISEPTTWPDEPKPKEYRGKTYDYYHATQKQRKMERDIRATKREIEAQIRQLENQRRMIKGYKAKLKKDTSYKGLWTVSFTLKEM
mgnify:CR=1 FL=1